jgi:16S rRNA processing protein RimM
VGHVLHPEGSEAPLTIASAGPVEDGPGWRLTFREIPDRQAAERLREVYLETVVDRDADLRPEELYWHEVEGMAVVGKTGRELGTVAEIYRAGPAEVYVVVGGSVPTFDMPAVRSVILEMSRERREIVIDEDVLDLDAPPVDGPPKAARRRPRWSRHGKGAPPGGGRPDPGEAVEAAEPVAEPGPAETGS